MTTGSARFRASLPPWLVAAGLFFIPLHHHPPMVGYPHTPGNDTRHSYAARYRENRAQMRALATTRGRYSGLFARWGHSRRQFLDLDPRGDGRAVEVLGDLSSARRVAVLVPGSGMSLDNYDDNGTAHPGTGPHADGLALRHELHALAPRNKVAVVVWLGYDTPEYVDVTAARSARAHAGGKALHRFLTTLPHRARISLMCHSYGSVVCADAVRTSRGRVGDLVALASPGLDVRSARALGTRIWSGRAADDPIQFTPYIRVAGFGHGADPSADNFGARVIATGHADGHAEYYQPGGTSLRNIADIALGRYHAIRRASGTTQ